MTFLATVCTTVRPILPDRCLSVCHVCLSLTLVHSGQTVGWIKMTLGTEVGVGPGDFVLDGDPASPPQKGGRSPPPRFSAHVYCGQTAGCINMPLGMEVGLSPKNFVLDGDQPIPQKGGGAPSPIFGPCLLRPNGSIDQDATWHGGWPQPRRLCVRWGPAHVYCAKTAGWIKMALGMEVGLGPGHIVLDGDPAPSPKRGRNPQFSAQTAAWIKMRLVRRLASAYATLC